MRGKKISRGASKGVYSLYITFDARKKTSHATNKMGEFILAGSLIPYK